MHEVDMHEPDTSWHTTLVAVVAMIAVCTVILYGLILASV